MVNTPFHGGFKKIKIKLCEFFRLNCAKNRSSHFYNNFLFFKDATKRCYCTMSSIVVVILSHGNDGTIMAYDEEYRFEEISEYFTPQNCRTLAGKPKLFFIQACRGTEKDLGVSLPTDSGFHTANSRPSSSSNQIVSSYADMYVAYSTVPRLVSYRDANKGTWFIQELCLVLDEQSDSKHLGDMMTVVIDRVTKLYAANKASGKGKQTPMYYSALTGLVYFKR